MSNLTPVQILADKYISWSARSYIAALRLESRGENAERLHNVSQAAALKAKLLLT